MESLPARSAMVRASLRMQGTPREFHVGPGAHVQLLHGCTEQVAAGFVHLAIGTHLGGPNPCRCKGVRICQQARALETLALALPRIRPVGSASTRSWMAPVSLPEQGRGLAQPVVGQFFVRLTDPASTRGTSTWPGGWSMRSSSAPEPVLSKVEGIRFW